LDIDAENGGIDGEEPFLKLPRGRVLAAALDE
jgi:hypothetical protein